MIKQLWTLLRKTMHLLRVSRMLKRRDRAYERYAYYKFLARAMLIRYNEIYGDDNHEST